MPRLRLLLLLITTFGCSLAFDPQLARSDMTGSSGRFLDERASSEVPIAVGSLQSLENQAKHPTNDTTTLILPGRSVGSLRLGDQEAKFYELFPRRPKVDERYEYPGCGVAMHWVDLDRVRAGGVGSTRETPWVGAPCLAGRPNVGLFACLFSRGYFTKSIPTTARAGGRRVAQLADFGCRIPFGTKGCGF
jgi:hypothetical protein